MGTKPDNQDRGTQELVEGNGQGVVRGISNSGTAAAILLLRRRLGARTAACRASNKRLYWQGRFQGHDGKTEAPGFKYTGNGTFEGDECEEVQRVAREYGLVRVREDSPGNGSLPDDDGR